MNVIFMGTPDFSVGTLEALVQAGHRVTAVVTQPDKPKGRGHGVQFPPVKEAALKYELPVYQPKRVKEPEFVETLRGIPADIIVVVAFGQIITKEILDMKPYGCINVHASLLPKYRGAAPIQWAVIDGEKESGVTIMQMDEGLDTGDMLLKDAVTLEAEETGGSLFDKLSRLGASLCVEALEKIENGTITREKQGETTTAYAKMLTKEMGQIDWSRPACEIERLVRGLNPWPSAYTHLDGKVLKIWKAAAAEELPGRTWGQVGKVTKDALYIACGEGSLKITELQLEGKKRMDTAAFLRGYAVEEQTLLQ